MPHFYRRTEEPTFTTPRSWATLHPTGQSSSQQINAWVTNNEIIKHGQDGCGVSGKNTKIRSRGEGYRLPKPIELEPPDLVMQHWTSWMSCWPRETYPGRVHLFKKNRKNTVKSRAARRASHRPPHLTSLSSPNIVVNNAKHGIEKRRTIAPFVYRYPLIQHWVAWFWTNVCTEH